MEPGVEVSLERVSVDLKEFIPKKNSCHTSVDFTIGDTHCWVIMYNQLDEYLLLLQMFGSGALPSPFQVTTYLLQGTVPYLHQTVRVAHHGKHEIWRSTKSELSKIIPDFEQQSEWRFKIVFLAANDSEEHPGDKSVQTPAYSDANFEIQSLSQDLSKLLDEDSSADVELKCGGVVFKAHKNLLSARSQVFRAMFESDMTEGKTGRVNIVDAEAETFGHFLRYLYAGKLDELTVDKATRFYEMGDKYAVDALKRQCASFLSENLSAANACSVLSLADLHTDDDLEDIATSYILEQKIHLQDDIWKGFCSEHPLLAKKVINRFCKLQVSNDKLSDI